MPTDLYRNFAALAASERPGADYSIIACPRPSPVAVIAPHGGGIEPGMSELARAIAGRVIGFALKRGTVHATNHLPG